MARQFQAADSGYIIEVGNRQFQFAAGMYHDTSSPGSIGAAFLASVGVTTANIGTVAGTPIASIGYYDGLLV